MTGCSINPDSFDSDQPPSSDGPFKKRKKPQAGKKKKNKKRKRGSQKGHKGHKQELLVPTDEKHVPYTTRCTCGGTEFADKGVYHTHQEVELPEIRMEVRHFHLHEDQCMGCLQTWKAPVPAEHRTGYGPRLNAMIGEVSSIQGNSRETVQSFCASILGFHISIGAIQNVVDRNSEAIAPHHERTGDIARDTLINHIDETTWKNEGDLNWVWVMANTVVAFFIVHTHRSKEAFE